MARGRRIAAAMVSVLLGGCLHPLPPTLGAATVRAADLPSEPERLIAYADGEFDQQIAARVENSIVALDKALGAGIGSYDALWRAARACGWLSLEYGDSKPQRARFAYKGVQYAKAAIKLDGKRVEGQYYLAINTGQWATTRTVGAYPLISEVVKAGKAALAADEHFDHGGPPRLLGTVYAKAPSWPVSVGDSDEALSYLARAVEIAGDYPHNHLLRADALLGDDRLDEAEREFGVVLAAAPLPEWATRLSRWKREAAEGMKKLQRKRGEK